MKVVDSGFPVPSVDERSALFAPCCDLCLAWPHSATEADRPGLPQLYCRLRPAPPAGRVMTLRERRVPPPPPVTCSGRPQHRRPAHSVVTPPLASLLCPRPRRPGRLPLARCGESGPQSAAAVSRFPRMMRLRSAGYLDVFTFYVIYRVV